MLGDDGEVVTYESTCVFGHVGREMSCMYRLNSVGESTEPCGTPSV